MTAKDLALGIIGQIGTDGATGHVIEYAGEAVRSLSMEGRMTLCNMSIEAGARAGMIAPDETTFAYLQGRRFAPATEIGIRRSLTGRHLATDDGASLMPSLKSMRRTLEPHVTWGTNPAMVVPVTGCVPDPVRLTVRPIDALRSARWNTWRSSRSPGLKTCRSIAFSSAHAPMHESKICAQPPVSCKGYRTSDSVRAMVVPGSQAVKRAAEAEGIDRDFSRRGF